MNELPLLDLFTQLRKEGFPLGIEEYQACLRALQAGFGIQDREALRRLCESLWAKSPDQKHRFNHLFEQIIPLEDTEEIPEGNAAILNEPISLPRLSSQFTRYLVWGSIFLILIGILLGLTQVAKILLRQLSSEPQPSPTISLSPSILPTLDASSTPSPTSQPSPSLVPPQIPPSTEKDKLIFGRFATIAFWGTSVVIAFAIGRLCTRLGSRFLPSSNNPRNPLRSNPFYTPRQLENDLKTPQALNQTDSGSKFPLNLEYFPVSRRQMQQSLRYLRRPVRRGPATELDIQETVRQIGQQGFLLEPKLVPPRTNRMTLLLLLDQDGSMAPFHILSNRLAETAQQGGRLGKVRIYYFHNCPIEYLYYDPACQDEEAISDTLTRLHSDYSAMLIFSDAGAVRGGYNTERVELTRIFLEQVRKKVQFIAWLNPMPDFRWQGTTAREIANLVPMFEFSRRGFQGAIDTLRGYSGSGKRR